MRRTETMNDGSKSSQNSGASLAGDTLFEIRCVDNWDDLTEYSAAWAELEVSLASSTIFQTFEWHQSWWKAFGDKYELFVILCHKNDQLVGIAPMMISNLASSGRRPKKVLRFIGCINDSSDYLDFLVDPQVPGTLDTILQSILAYLPKVDRILLSHFPSHLDTQQCTVNFFNAQKVRSVDEFHQEAPCRLMGDKQEDKRVANKSSLRRRYNYFQKSGNLQFQRCETESEILNYLDEFFEQHVARRDLTHDPSQFNDPAQRLFYRELVHEMLPCDWLKFHVVLFDENPLAFHFGFEHRNKFYWYKPTFDVHYAKRSPGEVLIKFLLEDAIDKDLNEFDFTVGSESFKYRFANEVRYNRRLILFRSYVDYWFYRTSIVAKRIRSRIAEMFTARRRDSSRH